MSKEIMTTDEAMAIVKSAMGKVQHCHEAHDLQEAHSHIECRLRQLSEQRAALLEAAKNTRDTLRSVLRVNCNCDDDFIDNQTAEIDAAIALAQGDAA